MIIWVDADACPNDAKDILFRAAVRTRTKLILVANNTLYPSRSPYISTVRVSQGFDEADNYIVDNLESGDLVITADIPLAADVIAKKGQVLNPRGERYTPNDIKQRLGMRNMMDQLRSSGVQTGGPSTYGSKEKANFARELDKILAKSN